MAKKEVGGSTRYVKFAEQKDGDVIVDGVYAGTIPSQYEPGFQYKFKEGESDVVISPAGQLRHRMASVQEGDKVEIVYRGQEKISKGKFAGKDAHQFKVFVDIPEPEGEEDDVPF